MTVQVVAADGTGERDWDVAGDPTTLTVGDVAAAVGVAVVDGRVVVDGRSVAAADRAMGRLPRGAWVGPPSACLEPPGIGEPSRPPGGDVAELHHVGGLGAGASLTVASGRYAVGRAPAGRPGLAWGLVGRLGALLVIDAAGSDRVVALPGAVLLVVAGAPSARRPPAPDERGLVPLHRSPRAPATSPIDPPAPPEAPARPPAPGPLSWFGLVAPVPVALGAAVVVSPRYALLGLAGPVLGLGRWAEARLRHRRRLRRHDTAAATMRAEHAAGVLAASEAEVLRRWSVAPDPARLAAAADHAAPPIWHRRASDVDALLLVVATGRLPWPAAAGMGGRATTGTIGPVPVTVPLLQRRAVGVTGPPAAARAVARWLVLQAVLLHGPADLALALVLHDDALAAWDAAKWLPHLLDGNGLARVATGRDRARSLLAAFGDELPDHRHAAAPATGRPDARRLGLLVADGTDIARSRSLRELVLRPGTPVRAVVVARTVDELPAWCDVVLAVAADGSARLSGDDEGTEPVLATGVSAAFAGEVARRLGRLHDPETTGGTGVPHVVGLVALLGVDDVLHDPGRLTDRIARRWDAARGGLAAPVGTSASGPFLLDLVADGPHALVAGTTGAGKSELLRTWIAALAASASPDDLNLVLVDFKGGGAFDACADLPHTVAVVTDLDAHLAARALRCLRAEVRHREGLLRHAGCADLVQYAASAPPAPLPRLVVIIDEFATLAAELPDFLGSIVDIAQRGRSLGLHLVLATQRPSGVLDSKVRANTNLRIALRVQDDGDSLDVIGTVDAARLSRRTPGRAFGRLGAGDVTPFQVALVSTITPVPRRPGTVTARPFVLHQPLAGEATDHDRGPGHHGSDLATLSRAARAAATHRGCRPPRVPWPPPLPDRVDACTLWGGSANQRGEAVLGLADEPDHQRQVPWRWQAEAGNLLVLGAQPTDTARTLLTLAVGLAHAHDPDDLHLYVVDGGSGALAPLAGLPHCGAYTVGGDTVGVGRMLQVLDDLLARRRSLVRQQRPGGSAGPPLDRAALPLVVLVVENAGGVLDALEADDDRRAPGLVASLLRDGAALGLALVLSVPHERALPGRLTALVPQRLALRLADPASYLALGLALRDVPSTSGLRAVSVPDGTEVHVAQLDDPDGTIETVALAHRGAPRARPPDPVPILGPQVRSITIAEPVGRMTDVHWSLPVAATPAFRPACLELPAGVHALVSGPPGSGRSTALVAAAIAALGAAGGGVHLVLVAPRRSATARAAGLPAAVADAAGLAHALASADHGRCLVLVDDAELVPADLAQILARCAATGDDRRRLVVAGRPDFLRSPGGWAAPLRAGRTGIALLPAPGDGDVFRTSFPTRLGLVPSPGRGFVVSLGTPHLAQVLLPD